MVPTFVLYYYNVINLLQQFGSKILLENFPDFIFDNFPYFRRKFCYKQNSFQTNAPGWCLMKCINYHRPATCSFHLPDFLTRIMFYRKFLKMHEYAFSILGNAWKLYNIFHAVSLHFLCCIEI